MTKMEKIIIKYSVKDVVRMLDSNPVTPDMIPEITIVQVMTRASMAHLSIL